ncbi:MAG TPA: M28 family metallopeptidase [Vicinamibacterales bacterium]
MTTMSRCACRRAILAGVFVLGAAALSVASPESVQRDPRVEKLLSQISEQRLVATLQKLGSFGTRNTLSSTDSATAGIGAARQWIFDEMKKSSPRLQVNFDSFQVPKSGRITRDIELRNVMAVLPGKTARRVYVSAHYDSFARRPVPASSPQPAGAPQAAGTPPPAAAAADTAPVDNPAPGVNDDGSGTALVMELARVFAESGIEFDATLVFIALAGEEQGLIGAQKHAEKALAEKVAIEGVLNNDMVGNVQAGDGLQDSTRVRVFSEAPEDSPSRQLARYVASAAARYVPTQQVTLVARHDRFGRGGDHTAFNQKGFTAVRITEALENFERQHTAADTIEGVNVPYFLRNVRINAAAAASIALAPPAPVVADGRGQPTLGRQPSGYDSNLKWKASPGAAGYKVYWREAWTPNWQHVLAVGNVTEFVLPSVSIDDYVFGVAAVGSDGSESLVAVYVNPPRR